MRSSRSISLLILLLSLLQVSYCQIGPVVLVDSSSLAALIGQPYDEGVVPGRPHAAWVSWVIRDSTGVNFLINDYQPDSLHLLVLSLHWPVDSVTGKFGQRTILDIMALRFSERYMRLIDRWCECDGVNDESIFAVVELTETPFFEHVVRAWRVNKKLRRFQEISTKGLRCENMGYGD
jgi:hypothetical protein